MGMILSEKQALSQFRKSGKGMGGKKAVRIAAPKGMKFGKTRISPKLRKQLGLK